MLSTCSQPRMPFPGLFDIREFADNLGYLQDPDNNTLINVGDNEVDSRDYDHIGGLLEKQKTTEYEVGYGGVKLQPGSNFREEDYYTF